MARQPGKAQPVEEQRHIYGPRPLGALVPKLTRPTFRSMNAATAQVMADWAAIVGPMLAEVSLPRRLSGDTLTIACAGPVAMELQHYATELMARINTHVGQATVRQLRFVQSGAMAPRRAAAKPPPPAWVAAAADKAVASLPDGELRAALAALGRAVLTQDATQAARSTSRSDPQ